MLSGIRVILLSPMAAADPTAGLAIADDLVAFFWNDVAPIWWGAQRNAGLFPTRWRHAAETCNLWVPGLEDPLSTPTRKWLFERVRALREHLIERRVPSGLVPRANRFHLAPLKRWTINADDRYQVVVLRAAALVASGAHVPLEPQDFDLFEQGYLGAWFDMNTKGTLPILNVKACHAVAGSDCALFCAMAGQRLPSTAGELELFGGWADVGEWFLRQRMQGWRASVGRGSFRSVDFGKQYADLLDLATLFGEPHWTAAWGASDSGRRVGLPPFYLCEQFDPPFYLRLQTRIPQYALRILMEGEWESVPVPAVSDTDAIEYALNHWHGAFLVQAGAVLECRGLHARPLQEVRVVRQFGARPSGQVLRRYGQRPEFRGGWHWSRLPW